MVTGIRVDIREADIHGIGTALLDMSAQANRIGGVGTFGRIGIAGNLPDRRHVDRHRAGVGRSVNVFHRIVKGDYAGEILRCGEDDVVCQALRDSAFTARQGVIAKGIKGCTIDILDETAAVGNEIVAQNVDRHIVAGSDGCAVVRGIDRIVVVVEVDNQHDRAGGGGGLRDAIFRTAFRAGREDVEIVNRVHACIGRFEHHIGKFCLRQGDGIAALRPLDTTHENLSTRGDIGNGDVDKGLTAIGIQQPHIDRITDLHVGIDGADNGRGGENRSVGQGIDFKRHGLTVQIDRSVGLRSDHCERDRDVHIAVLDRQHSDLALVPAGNVHLPAAEIVGGGEGERAVRQDNPGGDELGDHPLGFRRVIGNVADTDRLRGRIFVGRAVRLRDGQGYTVDNGLGIEGHPLGGLVSGSFHRVFDEVGAAEIVGRCVEKAAIGVQCDRAALGRSAGCSKGDRRAGGRLRSDDGQRIALRVAVIGEQTFGGVRDDRRVFIAHIDFRRDNRRCTDSGEGDRRLRAGGGHNAIIDCERRIARMCIGGQIGGIRVGIGDRLQGGFKIRQKGGACIGRQVQRDFTWDTRIEIRRYAKRSQSRLVNAKHVMCRCTGQRDGGRLQQFVIDIVDFDIAIDQNHRRIIGRSARHTVDVNDCVVVARSAAVILVQIERLHKGHVFAGIGVRTITIHIEGDCLLIGRIAYQDLRNTTPMGRDLGISRILTVFRAADCQNAPIVGNIQIGRGFSGYGLEIEKAQPDRIRRHRLTGNSIQVQEGKIDIVLRCQIVGTREQDFPQHGHCSGFQHVNAAHLPVHIANIGHDDAEIIQSGIDR